MSTSQYVRNDLDSALGYPNGYVRCPAGKVLTGLAFTHNTGPPSAKAGVVPRCGSPNGFTVDSSNEVKARTFSAGLGASNYASKGTHYEMDVVFKGTSRLVSVSSACVTRIHGKLR